VESTVAAVPVKESAMKIRKTLALVALAALALHAPRYARASEITCTGTNDRDAVQNALDAGGVVALKGICAIGTATLSMRSNTTLTGPATIVFDGGGAAVHFVDTNTTNVRDLTITSQNGGGFFFQNAALTRISGVKVNALGGDAFSLASGAGLWVRDVHINGRPGRGTRGFVLAGTWDSIWISDTLIEEQDSGIRIGGASGAIGNVWLSNVVMDRLGATGVGLHVEPNGSGAVSNVQATGLWTAGGHAMLLNSSQTTAPVANIILTNWRASESPNQIWTAGPIINLSTSQILFVSP
jgi:hypothetical protein